MTATLASLLRALDHQRAQLPPPVRAGSEPHARQAWALLARAAHRALTTLPVPAAKEVSAAGAVLLPLTTYLQHRAVLGPYEPLADVATTLGGIADLLHTPVIASPATLAAAQRDVVGHTLYAIQGSAVWTARTLRPSPGPSLLSRQLPRLAGLDAGQDPGTIDAVRLYPWQSVRLRDPGIDGAVARWSSAALAILRSPSNVTQLALQLTAADIALICAAAAASVSAGVRTQVLTAESGTPVEALTEASGSWRRAAVWPSNVRLGGRSNDLRDASQDLREQITRQLRDGQHWKADPQLGTPAIIASMLWATQTAHHLGVAHEHALHELADGASRAWVARDTVSAPFPSVADQLATARYAWIPDLEHQHAAATVHRATREALAVARSALVVVAAAVERANPANQEATVWETLGLSPGFAAVRQQHCQLGLASQHRVGRATGTFAPPTT